MCYVLLSAIVTAPSVVVAMLGCGHGAASVRQRVPTLIFIPIHVQPGTGPGRRLALSAVQRIESMSCDCVVLKPYNKDPKDSISGPQWGPRT